MTTLKQETLKTLENEKKFDFDMGTFNEGKYIYTKNKNRKNYCGTASCVAGHIVAAGARMGRTVPAELLKEPLFNRLTHEWDDPGADLMEKLALKDDESTTARAARYLWSKAYGKRRANLLDFYAYTFANDAPNLSEVTAEEAINYLRGA